MTRARAFKGVTRQKNPHAEGVMPPNIGNADFSMRRRPSAQQVSGPEFPTKRILLLQRRAADDLAKSVNSCPATIGQLNRHSLELQTHQKAG